MIGLFALLMYFPLCFFKSSIEIHLTTVIRSSSPNLFSPLRFVIDRANRQQTALTPKKNGAIIYTTLKLTFNYNVIITNCQWVYNILQEGFA